jgi:DNA primase
LITYLQDRCIEFPDRLNQLQPLFQLNEKTQRDLSRATLVMRAATACLERVMCEKRYRHFHDLWQKTDCINTPDLGQHYQQQMYAEKQRIAELDRQQRQTTFSDLAQTPWVGEFYSTLETSS